MASIWKLVYRLLVIPALWVVLRLASLTSRKVRRGIRGRRNLFPLLERRVAALAPGKRVWFHASSMGEFEQAKPIINELKRRRPDVRILTTFFSPSGYENSRRYRAIDAVSYLPFDTASNARRFIRTARPDVAVMVRYDIWPNHIWELKAQGVPTLIANATMSRQSERRIPLARSFHREVYDAIDAILTVSANDAAAFRGFGLTRPLVEPVGDTRFDQVSVRSVEARRRHVLAERIVAGRKVLVAGSTWPEDEEVLLPAFLQLQASMPEALLILVPHEPTVEHLEDVEAMLAGTTSSIRFSALNDYNGERVIVVDGIGILMALYASAHVAFIGGSFRQGVHNTLEAAVYGIPVLFGPKHRNSQEPLQLVGAGGGFVVGDDAELHRVLENLFRDETARIAAGRRAAQFVEANTGATDRFLHHLETFLNRERSGTA